MPATPRFQTLLAAVQTYWASSSCANARAIATDGLWLDRVPETKTTAFVVLQYTGGSVQRTMGPIDTDRVSLTFMCHVEDDDSGSVLVSQLADAVIEAFDNASLTVTGYGVVYCQRQSSPTVYEDPEKGWNASMEYIVEFG